MEVICPKCSRHLESEDINASRDTAFCKNCGEAFKLSELVHSVDTVGFDENEPPDGAWFARTEDGFILGSSARSNMGCFIVPFMIFWNTFIFVFLIGQLTTGEDFPIINLVFMLPFFIAGLFLLVFAIYTIWGITVIKVSGDEGMIFWGVKKYGRKKRFDWSEIEEVSEREYRTNKGGIQRMIVLEGNNEINFGTMLKNERRRFMLDALKAMLVEYKSKRLSRG